MAEYTLNEHGIIQNPGKFQGEPAYVPEFWVLGLEGFADDDDGESFRFDLNESDYGAYPELVGYFRLYLVEDSNGFVHSTLE